METKKTKLDNVRAFVVKYKVIVTIITVIAIVVLAVFVQRSISIAQKKNLIDCGIVYYTRNGNRYHLFDNCSNMVDPVVSNEDDSISSGRSRCGKCYKYVFGYHRMKSVNEIVFELDKYYKEQYTESFFIQEYKAYYVFECATMGKEALKNNYVDVGGTEYNSYDVNEQICINQSKNNHAWFSDNGHEEIDVWNIIYDENGNIVISVKNGVPTDWDWDSIGFNNPMKQ